MTTERKTALGTPDASATRMSSRQPQSIFQETFATLQAGLVLRPGALS